MKKIKYSSNPYKAAKLSLKVKLKSLAAESKIIKRMEDKLPGNSMDRLSLYNHRKEVVRKECRCTHLAVALLKGMPYSVVEGPSKKKSPIDMDRVARIVQKYGEIVDEEGKRKKIKDPLTIVREWVQ